ncbi:MAG: hypothetical protein J6Y20_07300 [Lachnospiraceae bacterium]|nr:hypothetical protein [Lachnospiraceae bacterium]
MLEDVDLKLILLLDVWVHIVLHVIWFLVRTFIHEPKVVRFLERLRIVEVEDEFEEAEER